jgi:hypothetical protein
MFSEQIMERLAEHFHSHEDEHLRCDGAGHSIQPPYVPTTVTHGLHPVRQALMAYGGTPEANAAARVAYWAKVLEFLDKHLG